MKYGFTVPSRGPLATPDALVTIARRGEELGYDSISIGDHIVIPRNIESIYPDTEGGEFPGGASGASLEQLNVLSFLAGQTQKIRLVTRVMIVPHRNPLVAANAKALTTIDVLSQGRLVVGIGAGWMREDFEALGIPPFEKRGAVTDEYLQAIRELWTSNGPTFKGIAASPTSPSCPSWCRNPIRPSGWAVRVAGPCGGPPAFVTAGTPSIPTPSFYWSRRTC